MNDATNAPDNEPEKTELAEDAELRTQSHPDTPLPLQKKKSKKKLIVFLILALVVIGAAVAAFVYFVIPNYITPKVANDDTGYASATHFDSAKALVSDVTTDLSGSVVDAVVTSGFGGKTADGFGAYSVPTYKVGDRKYANLPATTSGTSYKGSSVDAASNYTALTDFFKKNKFKTLSSGKDTTGINEWFSNDLKYISFASYESSNILCMAWHVDASSTAIKQHVTSVGCADKSSYEAAAKELDQFFAAYTKGEDSPTETIVLGVPMGSPGADGYENVTLYQEDPIQTEAKVFQGLYYRAKGEKDWTFFIGSYGLLSCSEYKTDVLKKAFKDFSCYNESTKAYTTVL